jgi:hypothetical protein
MNIALSGEVVIWFDLNSLVQISAQEAAALTEIFRGFAQFIQANARTVPQINQNPFQVINHLVIRC